MNKLAFYGHKIFFENTSNCDWLSIINGCYRNVEFAETAYNSSLVDEDDKEIISGILISHNIKKEVFPDFLYYDFNYPTKETLFSFKRDEELFEERIEDFVFLCILNDWKDLYDSIDHTHRSHKGYSLALYQDKKYYINHQLSLKTNKEVDDSYFLRYLNTNILEENTNHYPKPDESGYNSLLEYHSEEEYKDEPSIIPDNPSKYDIVNSFEIAYELFKRGNSSNLVLSKIINTSPDNFIELYRKYKPFLLFTRNEVYSPNLIKENSLLQYNIMYIRTITTSVTHNKYLGVETDLPEYNIYLLALKLRNKKVLEYILDLYSFHGKLYKVMDLENECYLDPPIEILELPKQENIDILKGDELNPYFL